MGLKEAYQEKIEAQIREWDAKVEELKAKAQQAKAEAKIRMEEQLLVLKESREGIVQKLDALKEIGEDKWESLQEGTDKAWSNMKNMLENFMNQNK
ncbi:MAG: coiled coil domain-containing protein [Candidatus Aceula meridiana]|nr:coiled coil domain-containing protein [Candidatus Aceula meridiana]